MPSLADFLAGVVRDADLRGRATDDLGAAMSSFGVAAAEQALMRAGGPELVALLVHDAQTPRPPPDEPAAADLKLALSPAIDPRGRLVHTATLLGASQELPPSVQAAVVFRVRVSGSWAVIDPIDDEASWDNEVDADTAMPTAPWRHRVDHDATRRAARVVHDSSPDARMQALLDLISAMADPT